MRFLLDLNKERSESFLEDLQRRSAFLFSRLPFLMLSLNQGARDLIEMERDCSGACWLSTDDSVLL